LFAPPVHLHLSTLQNRLPPKFTLFPYTTLFRSLYKISKEEGNDTNNYQDGSLPSGRQGLHGAEPERRPCPVFHQEHCGALRGQRSEEHTSELQSRFDLVCRLLLEKKKAGVARTL